MAHWRLVQSRGQSDEAIDRGMRAYLSTRALTEQQTEIARRELSHFIDVMMVKPSPERVDADSLKSD